MYGEAFSVIRVQRALLSIMRENKANKSYNSRLTRWVDRLLPFDFSIDHLLGSKMGLVDYISREPRQKLLTSPLMMSYSLLPYWTLLNAVRNAFY